VLVGYSERNGKLYELHPREAGKQRRDIGMVFQHFNLFPHMTALENIIEAPTRVKKRSKQEAIATARRLLDQVGLAGKEKAYPAQLSGGQQQRVAIARALAGAPRFLLADEPTGNLDSLMARQVVDLLEDINRRGTTIVMVTHDPELARRAHRNVYVMDGQVTDLQPFAAKPLVRPEAVAAGV
jgi:polar amino acid transport system ATP-binding protein